MIMQIEALRAKLDELEQHVGSAFSSAQQKPTIPTSVPASHARDNVPTSLSLFDRLSRLLRGL